MAYYFLDRENQLLAQTTKLRQAAEQLARPECNQLSEVEEKSIKNRKKISLDITVPPMESTTNGIIAV